MILDPKALRLYALVMFPVVIAAVWFVYQERHRSEPVPVSLPESSVAVSVGGKIFSAEIADTPATRELGLGLRDSLCTDCAMLFLFDQPGRYAFWMKGMKFPLDLAWIRDGKTVFIEKNIPADSTAIMTPDTDATEVLETNAGALLDVKVGDEITINGAR
jgi:uncharacterized membrane protein (UPF0127 family)